MFPGSPLSADTASARYSPSGRLVSAQYASLILVGQVNLTELALTGTAQMGHLVDRLVACRYL